MKEDSISMLEFGILLLLSLLVILSFVIVYFQSVQNIDIELPIGFLLLVLIGVNLTDLAFQARNHETNKKM